MAHIDRPRTSILIGRLHPLVAEFGMIRVGSSRIVPVTPPNAVLERRTKMQQLGRHILSTLSAKHSLPLSLKHSLSTGITIEIGIPIPWPKPRQRPNLHMPLRAQVDLPR